MPIYEYACTACDHRTDILHGINDPGPHFCPSCGKEGTMRKLFAPPAIHYKGTGWAKKDRGGSSRTRASTSAASSGEGKPASGDSGDSSTSAPASGASSGGSTPGSSAGGGSTPGSSSGGDSSSSED